METLNVDLKWSLWSADRDHWEECAKDAYDRIAKAFTGEAPPVCVYTAPRKEIRYGTVVIEKNKARVTFQAGWDDPLYQVPSEIPEDKHEQAAEAITEWHRDRYGFIDSETPAGAVVEGVVVDGDFKSFMQSIDDYEHMLQERESDESDAFDEFLLGLIEEFTATTEDKEATP